MKQKKTRDFLIRNMPIETFNLLKVQANKNGRSKTQEAIIAIKIGLSSCREPIFQPTPIKWKKKISGHQ